ncbi:MAG: DMT family transporter [bacterium]
MKKLFNKHVQGPVAILLSTFLFAFSHMQAKLLTNAGMNGLEASFLRGIGGTVMIVAILLSQGKRIATKSPKYLLLRGITGGIALALFYKAIELGSYANANTLNASSPVWVNVLAVLFLGEKLTWRKFFAISIAIAGVYFVINPHFSELSIADTLGLLSGIMSGVAIIFLKKCRKADDPWIVALSFFVFGGTFSTFGLTASFSSNVTSFWTIVLLLIIASTFAQFFLSVGYERATASAGSVLSLMTIVWGSMLSYFVLHEALSPFFFLGSFMIFASGVLVNSENRHKRKSEVIQMS